MRVPSSMQSLVSSAAKIAAVGSSGLLATPMMDGANHLLGLTMSGIIHSAEWPAGVSEGEGRVMTYRHPNALYLVAYIYVTASAQTSATLQVKAGTGATVTVPVPAPGGYWITAPWGGTGWREIYYKATSCSIGFVTLWHLRRTTLTPGTDLAADRVNSAHPGAGLDAEHVIVHDSTDSDLSGVAQAIEEARLYGTRQAVAWVTLGGDVTVVGAPGAWQNPVSPLTWAHGCRATLGTTTRSYRCYVRSYNVGGTWYRWRITSTSGGSATTANLVNAAMTWDYVDGLAIDADDELTLEVWGNGGPTIYIDAVSVAEIPT